MAKVTFTTLAMALLVKHNQEHRCLRPVVRVMWLKRQWDNRRSQSGENVYFQDGYEGWAIAVMDWNDQTTTELRDLWVVTRQGDLEVSFSSDVEEFKGELVVDAADSRFIVTAI